MLHFTTAVVHFFQIKKTASVALGVYAFTGVDTVEGFYGCGKFSIIKRTLKCNDKSHMETMQQLNGMKNELSDDMLLCLQEFTTRIVYNDPVSRELCEARARKWRISKNNDSARLPPDRDSFKQHCLRAHLQAYEWKHAEACTIIAIITVWMEISRRCVAPGDAYGRCTSRWSQFR